MSEHERRANCRAIDHCSNCLRFSRSNYRGCAMQSIRCRLPNRYRCICVICRRIHLRALGWLRLYRHGIGSVTRGGAYLAAEERFLLGSHHPRRAGRGRTSRNRMLRLKGRMSGLKLVSASHVYDGRSGGNRRGTIVVAMVPTSNNAFERSVSYRGPRLSRQSGRWSAAQLDR